MYISSYASKYIYIYIYIYIYLNILIRSGKDIQWSTIT